MHPFGYGQELYFPSLIVSVLIFGLNSGMSAYEGVMHITHPVVTVDPTWNYIVFGWSTVFEGISLVLPRRKFTKVSAHFGISYVPVKTLLFL